MKPMTLRKYKSEDCPVLANLFYNTVHTVNAKDYTEAQLAVWATGTVNLSDWDKSFSAHTTVIAEKDGNIVGFGDMDSSGYLNRLYVHDAYQGKGIATAIVKELEQQTMSHGVSFFITHASITAKLFFEKQGYSVIRENKVIRNSIELTNFIMRKNCTKKQ